MKPVNLDDFNEVLDEVIDIFGSIFILLSRYEEYILTEENFDHFGRFKLNSAINKERLNTPIVDELINLLVRLLEERLDVRIQVKQSSYEISPSHDVDRPFVYLYYSKRHLLKRLGGDVLIRRSFHSFTERYRKYKEVKKGDLDKDPFNTFGWLMKESEKNNIKSTFYFLASVTEPKYDQDYSLEDEALQKLLLEINERGHFIGLHPSFKASEIEGQVLREYKILKKTCEHLGITKDINTVRYHYLRWNNKSIVELEDAGISKDQTLTFAEKPGFRCGTCKPYAGFNFNTMKAANLIIQPLIVMEKSLFSSSYMNLLDSLDDAWNIVSDLKTKCEQQNGIFTLLWHNNYFDSEKLNEFYQACIQ